MTAPTQMQPIDAFSREVEQLIEIVGEPHGLAEHLILAQARNTARDWRERCRSAQAFTGRNEVMATHHADLARQHESTLRAYIYAILVYREESIR